jgi:hypothetical protein
MARLLRRKASAPPYGPRRGPDESLEDHLRRIANHRGWITAPLAGDVLVLLNEVRALKRRIEQLEARLD